MCARLEPAAGAVPHRRWRFASNIGGTATLIGDPPNIIIGSRGGLSFNDFLVHSLPIVGCPGRRVSCCLPACCSAQSFVGDPERVADGAWNSTRATRSSTARLLVRCLRRARRSSMAAFVLHTVLHLDPSIVALLGAGVLMVVSPACRPRWPLAEIEWPTLVFFMGLFVLVGGLVELRRDRPRSAAAAIGAVGGDTGAAAYGAALRLRRGLRPSSTTSPTSPP